ncbi:hypothetical protein PLICBS_004692 [Purpureocillium lilacinum]|uniref:uncharacterized protein n=1 Tax=Purpureocillium lilacinum TaxID=33203 RepID=UPI00208CE30A|nr:hypothetical protein PLICBS_004692 [Purpureocillium lilacinum]
MASHQQHHYHHVAQHHPPPLPRSLSDYDSLLKFPRRGNEHKSPPVHVKLSKRPSGHRAWRHCRASSRWLWEALSLTASTVALVAIIILLRVYQDRTLEQWGLPVSINAVLAILSAVFKATLALPVTEVNIELPPGISQLKWFWFADRARGLDDMQAFDNASRGPWGSLLLIFRQFTPRRDRSYLAAFGAVLLLLALAVDPFSQALISYYSCLVRSTDRAAIPRVNFYTATGAHVGAGSEALDAPMQLALYLGVLDPPDNSSASVVVDCRTGNCTFPADTGATFTTLSICHTCTNLTSSIIKPAGMYNWSLPGGQVLNHEGALLNTTISRLGGWSPLGKRDALFNITLLSRARGRNCPTCIRFGREFAASCEFAPCIKTYAANLTKGRYEERELDQQRLNWGEFTMDYSLAVNRTLRGGVWTDCTWTGTKTETHTIQVFKTNRTVTNDWADGTFSYNRYKATYPNRTLPVTVWYRPDCVFKFGYRASDAIFQNLDEYFWGGKTLQFGGSVEGNYGLIWLQSLWNNGSIDIAGVDGFMGRLGLGMAAQMRRNPETEAEAFALGQSWKADTCIGVQWAFLSFPATLLVLEVLFFAGLVLAGRHSAWLGDWKSSALAPLFHGFARVDDGARGGTGGRAAPGSADGMLAAAKRIEVRLTDDGGQWMLQATRRPAGGGGGGGGDGGGGPAAAAGRGGGW